MNGLGYGLIEMDGTVYYQCNYKGYTFEYEAPAADYEDYTFQQEYQETDENGDPVGDSTMVDVTIKRMKDTAQSALNVKAYFDNNIAGSAALKTWECGIYNELEKDVQIFSDEDSLKAAYPEKDFTQTYDDGSVKAIDEVLDMQVKTCIDGSLIVLTKKTLSEAQIVEL